MLQFILSVAILAKASCGGGGHGGEGAVMEDVTPSAAAGQAKSSSLILQQLCAELDAVAAFQRPDRAAGDSSASDVAAASASSSSSSWQPPPLRSRWPTKADREEEEEEEEEATETESVKEEKAADAAWVAAGDAFEQTANALGAHPWAVRPEAKGRSTDLSPEELDRLRSEKAASAGIRWQDRGPAQSYDKTGKPTHDNWRGQAWREGSQGGKQRYAKRGGKYAEYYKDLNKRGMLQPGPDGARVMKARREDEKWGWSAKDEL
jgi:hypothetical protein